MEARPRGESVRSVLLELVAPALLTVLLSSWGLGRGPLLRRIDAYRPGRASGVNRATIVQSQTLHAEASSQAKRGCDHVAIFGSSSVVNGVAPDELDAAMASRVPARTSLMVASTGLMAYEYPMLLRQLVTSAPAAALVLYNTFSFGNQLHPTAISTRWNTREFLAIARTEDVVALGWRELADALLGELLFVKRYRLVLRFLAVEALGRRLRENSEPYDYPPGQPVLGRRPRTMQPAVQSSEPFYWIRSSYLESAARADTLGYRGLTRFLQLSRQRGIQVTVAPVPHPDFAAFDAYAQGADTAAVDRAVEAVCVREGARFVKRAWIRDLEADDALFRDAVHLHDEGRRRYTARLAELLK